MPAAEAFIGGNGQLEIVPTRVVNSGDLFVFTEAQVEDPVGRNLGQGALHSAVHSVERVPSPPETMRTAEEPTYETPDPQPATL